jgi:LCP family protein required for cell wall assembly
MASTDVAVRPRRSAFAAAFLSFLFPGLGHAYLGRWLRAVLWAALPILAIAAGGALLLGPDRNEIVTSFADPAMLQWVFVGLAVDLLYRLLAVLDAWRLARDPSVGSGGTRMLSVLGLVGVIIVLLGSHVAVAQPVFIARDTINGVTENSGDQTEVADLGALAEQDVSFVLNLTEPQAAGSPDPNATPAVGAPAVPTLPPPDAGDASAEATDATGTGTGAGTEWDGKKRLNILLVGADGGRAGVPSYLTDTMIVVSIDPATGRLAFISLPRDTSGIPLPKSWPAARTFGGSYNNKINTLYTVARGRPDLFPGNDAQRGYAALMGALGELYGLDIDWYVAVDLNSFRSVVNTLGGVVVDVQLPVYDTGYPADDGRGKLKLYVPPGMVRMNGQQALAYARSRHGSSDFDRSSRQQRVITSIREQTDLGDLLKPGVISELLKQFRKDIKTNIPPKQLPALISLAEKVDLDRRVNLVLSDSAGYSSVCYPCGASGLWMLKARPALMRQAAQDVFSRSREQARTINDLQEEGATVHILNGQGGANVKAVNIAAYLAKAGMDATVPPVDDGKADSEDYANTRITVYNGAEEAMPETFARLKRVFKDKGAEVVLEEDADQAADFVVVVGDKTKAYKP